MARRQHTPKGRRLLLTGTLLLVLLATGILVTGRIINRTAAQMSGRIITQIGESHCNLLNAEFGRSEEVLGIAADFTRTHTAPSEAELHVLTATLIRLDPKAERIWFDESGRHSFRSFTRDGKSPEATDNAGFRRRLTTEFGADSIRSCVICSGGVEVWSMARLITDDAGRRRICGVDFPLRSIFAYMSEHYPAGRSYATLFDPEGVVVYHPDSLKVGRPAADPEEVAAFREVSATGRQVITRTVSDFLGVEEQNIYYPISLGGSHWVARISIPRMVIEQEIGDFHFYTILTAVISVLFFAALLILAQRRWRREYDLRRLSERESEQLQLQQVLEQIDPHFLFNSLTSLYALIPRDPGQAREFTLSLSRVYRHVLERRRQILSKLSEEIDFTWQYYTLQKIRFGNRIELTTAIDPALRNWQIPSMSMQTLVENAVKHNRITDLNPLHVSIRTEGNSLVIENNSTPREDGDAESLGIGLERIRSVYRFYTGENISISTDGETFRCRLPLLPPEK